MKELREKLLYQETLDLDDGDARSILTDLIDKDTAMKPDRLDGFRCRNCSGKLARQTDLVGQKYCHHCGQKIDWED